MTQHRFDPAFTNPTELDEFIAGNEAIAVDANEVVAEFEFERFQGFLDEVFTAGMMDNHVFFFRLQVTDVFDCDQAQAATQACAQVAALFSVGCGALVMGAFIFGRTAGNEGPGTIECGGEALATDRFDEVVDGSRFERGQCMLIEGGAKDDGRARIEYSKLACGFQAVEAGHRNVQQHHVRRMGIAGVECGVTVTSLGDQLHVHMIGEERAQALTGHRFVVCDKDFHVIVRPDPMKGC